jgi:hypothetical protein
MVYGLFGKAVRKSLSSNFKKKNLLKIFYIFLDRFDVLISKIIFKK